MSQYSSYPLSSANNAQGQRISYKTRGITILLALFFGGFGVHRFYLNRPGSGVLYAVFFWTFIPAIVALIEILLLLMMSNREFDRKYNMEAD